MTSVMFDSQRVVVRERYGHSSIQRDYEARSDGCLQSFDKSPRHTSVSHFFRTVFLPQGYPESVSEDYLSYQLWDTVQAFASSVSGTLAAHSLLQGIGVGNESATVLAATFTWLLKDGTGMVGRIVFAWMKGHKLDCDAKRWRLFADILNDCAMFLEILAPVFEGYFRLVVCTAGVAKSLVGVAGGATRAALTQHQARRNNMADVSAKDGSQETLVNLSALLVSMLLLPLISGQQMLTYSAFFLLTLLHLFANYRAVKSVCMESLNQARLHLIVQHYLTTGQVPGVAHVNVREPVVWPIRRRLKVELGVSFSDIASSPGQLTQLRRAYDDISAQYVLYYDKQKGAALIMLGEQASVREQLQACLQAEMVNFLLDPGPEAVCQELQSVLGDIRLDDEADAMRRTYLAAEKMFPDFLHSVTTHGWLTDCSLLGADEWRASWCFSGLPDKKYF